MKAHYAPNVEDSSSGESSSEKDVSEDVSDDVENIGGEDEAKSNLRSGRNVDTESGSQSSMDESDESSPPPKHFAPVSPDFKKRKDDVTSKQEKFPKSDRAAKVEAPASVSEDKTKFQKGNAASKKAVQPKEETKKKEMPSQDQQRAAGQVNPSPHKRKQQPDHANQKQDSELKPRKAAHTWTPKDELLLASQFLIDMRHGKVFPFKKADPYWDELWQRLHGRLEIDWSKEQMYDKYRRMKLRYDVLNERLKSDDTKLQKYKSPEEEKLFKVFQQLWGKDGVESNKKSGKPQKKSPTPSEEEEEEESSPSSGVKPAREEKDHAVDEEDETTEEEEEEPEPEKSAIEPAAKKPKPSKQLDQNGTIQTNPEPLDLKTLPAKGQDMSQIYSSEDFSKAVHAASLSFVADSQAKLLDIFKEEQAKAHALLEKILNQEQSKNAAMEKIVKEFRWFSQLLMMSLPTGNQNTGMPRMLQAFPDIFPIEDSTSTVSLKHEWLEQQNREIEVEIQRSQLMQNMNRAWQEQLKRQGN